MDKEMQKARRFNIVVFTAFVLIFVMAVFGLLRYKYWHTFTPGKWLEYPEKRAKMTADLFEDFDLIGMSEDEIIELLGNNNNDYGYFNKDNRFVYYLGNERTIIDSEWLLIDFENNVVCDYSMTMD